MKNSNEAREVPEGWAAEPSTPDWALDWGRLLRIARQVAGLSLMELSARTQLSKGYLSKLESGAAGAANPSRATLAALARALPSFGPVAHMFGPGGAREALDFEQTASPPRPTLRVVASPSTEPGAPIALGWRALEVFTALVALDAAALSNVYTAVVIARAVGRSLAEVAPVLEELVDMALVIREPPTRTGAQPSYRCSDHATTSLGVARLGDVLVLAAALLAASTAPARDKGGTARRIVSAPQDNATQGSE